MSSASIAPPTDKTPGDAPHTWHVVYAPPRRQRRRPAWTEDIPCPGCGETRTITGRSRWYFTQARAHLCRVCAPKKTWAEWQHRFVVDGPSIPAAKQYTAKVATTKYDYDPETAVDWVVVHRLATGVTVPYSTRSERVAAVAQLTAEGLSAQAIARRMNVSQRTVVRLRAAIRNEAATPEEHRDDEVA